jgi:hypothetical protein
MLNVSDPLLRAHVYEPLAHRASTAHHHQQEKNKYIATQQILKIEKGGKEKEKKKKKKEKGEKENKSTEPRQRRHTIKQGKKFPHRQ